MLVDIKEHLHLVAPALIEMLPVAADLSRQRSNLVRAVAAPGTDHSGPAGNQIIAREKFLQLSLHAPAVERCPQSREKQVNGATLGLGDDFGRAVSLIVIAALMLFHLAMAGMTSQVNHKCLGGK